MQYYTFCICQENRLQKLTLGEFNRYIYFKTRTLVIKPLKEYVKSIQQKLSVSK